MNGRFILGAVCLLLSPTLHGQTAAPASPPRTIPVERSLAVGGQGYFPVALRLRDGRIAVVLRGGGPHLSIQGRLDMIFSADEGRTWSKPAVVVDSPLDDRNPSLGEAQDGTLVVGFWRTATYDDKGKYEPKLDKPRNTWVTRSKDSGKTWSDAAEIDVSDIGIGSPFGKIVTLPDGAMLMAIYGFDIRPAGEKKPGDRNHSYVFRSTDNGQTWKRLSEIGDGKLQLNETSLLRLADGKILAAARSRAGEVWTALSSDAGATWSAPQHLTPASVHPADLILLPDNRVLITLGDRRKPNGVLGMVGDAAGTFNWDKHFTLMDDAASADCGYPSNVLLKDGKVLTVYYATKALGQPAWGVHCGALIYAVPVE